MISSLVEVGYICRHARRTGFKLALVVGYSNSKLRVRFWRAAGRKWTLPTPVGPEDLSSLSETDLAKHAALIKRASAAAIEHSFTPRVWS